MHEKNRKLFEELCNASTEADELSQLLKGLSYCMRSYALKEDFATLSRIVDTLKEQFRITSLFIKYVDYPVLEEGEKKNNADW